MSDSTPTQTPTPERRDPMGDWLARDLFDSLPEGLPELEDEEDDE